MTFALSTRYSCGNERRREVVRADGTLNGIDFVEVTPDQQTILVHFLQPLPGTGAGAVPAGPALTVDDVRIDGSARVRRVAVLAVEAAAAVLTVTVDRPGDFSQYRLAIVDPVSEAAPDHFDPRLSEVHFSFKASCPSDDDCGLPVTCPPSLRAEPAIDYLAKDYDSFRALMLDRLATTAPGWTERNVADAGVALVELLAFVADRMSYEQDAVATEAYLTTAHRRVSVRRHARLLDYHMHDGASARTFVHFDVDTGLLVPGRTGVRTPLGTATTVFETLHDVPARASHNAISIHTWSDEECCLPVGSTRATLVDAGLALAPGDLLLFEELIDPTSGGDADPSHRQVVRLSEVTAGTDPLGPTGVVEVAWDRADGLRFPLCVSSERGPVAVARGNIALADHGETRTAVLAATGTTSNGPALPEPGVACVVALDASAPAASVLATDPHRAVAAVVLDDGDLEWIPRPDLLDAAPGDPSFVVEVDDYGTAHLRFGDDESGQRPPSGATFSATYRIGGGAAGNVAAEALTQLVEPISGVTAARNPLPAAGGVDPESSEAVRQLAPHAFRRQERAVTEADYGTLADRIPGVQRMAGNLRWTGSWYTAFVTVDPLAGGVPDDNLRRLTTGTLDRFRMAGVDVEVTAPQPVPVELALDVCVAEGYAAATVRAEIVDALSDGLRNDGRRGFFHPDYFTFGQPLYLSAVYRAVLDVAGVSWVQATTFRRFGHGNAGALTAGVLKVGATEIVQLAGDPNFPERGRLTVATSGGR